MKLAEHYLHLQSHLSTLREKDTYKITIQEISDILYCTKRHAKHILKQLSEREWISWNIVRGRGKRSTLTFLLSKDEVIVELAKDLVQQGKHQQALEQLGSVSTNIQEQFHDWLHGQLGFIIEKKNEKEVDVLRYPFYKAIKSLDPARAMSRHEGHLIEHLFDTLLTYNDDKDELEPHIAHHWEDHDEGRIWTFYLRKGVRFHHGREMTAYDVVETMNRLKSISALHLNSWMYHTIKEIKVIRSSIVQFILTESNYLFPHYLCHNQTSIIPIEVWKEDQCGFSTLPVGTGPFKVIKNDDTMMVLETFETYFQGRAHLDRVEILTLPELYPNNNQLINHWINFGSHEQQEQWDKLKQIEQGASYVTLNLHKEGPQ
jgi:SgrR family transcriptional regulator